MLDLEVIGQGATTMIYHDGEKAVKLYVDTPANEAENEAALQRFAFNAGLPVPAVFGVRKLNDTTTALDMAYIDGKPLMWPQMDKEERRSAIHVLADLQCEIHKVRTNGFPKQADRFSWKIEHTPHLDDELKNQLLVDLTRLGTGTECLCHGDFHPLNILFDGSKHWIIDWVDATAGNPLADACRTYLIFKQHMARSSGIYLRAFCEIAGVKQDDVLAWLPVVASARLDENMDDKSRRWLLDLIKEAEGLE